MANRPFRERLQNARMSVTGAGAEENTDGRMKFGSRHTRVQVEGRLMGGRILPEGVGKRRRPRAATAAERACTQRLRPQRPVKICRLRKLIRCWHAVRGKI